MARAPNRPKPGVRVETLHHEEARRKNIPTAEYRPVLEKHKQQPVEVMYPRGAAAGALEAEKEARDRDLDPQLVWRGKDRQDWSDLVVHAPPLYIQEKVHAKALVDDLLRFSPSPRERGEGGGEGSPRDQIDLFADFNGIPKDADKTEFYAHDQNWSNRMILGDSLQVMCSLAEREGLRGKVQCIYFDPPYGIKFNSNFQWSTTSRDVKDGNAAHITREPEQVKAFRDTWRDGIHSYLTYLRDRLTVARDLLTESGSIFVQIGDENLHRVRLLMDEVLGEKNFVAQISFKTTDPLGQVGVARVYDFIVWFAKDASFFKFHGLFNDRDISQDKEYRFSDSIDLSKATDREGPEFLRSVYRRRNATSSGFTASCTFPLRVFGKDYSPSGGKSWSSNREGMARAAKANRFFILGKDPYYKQYQSDFPFSQFENVWSDKPAAQAKRYVVETADKFVQRCLLMVTDPGDLVLDPTCGSGTTAYVAEQWARRWITIDTSRVALALARARIMGARYPYYLLADSREGQAKEAEVTRSVPSTQPIHGSIRQGFVYERVPHITLKSIANNAEIDVIWDEWQKTLEPLRERLNAATKASWAEWEVPRDADAKWPDAAKKLHADWWRARIARQKAIDASIAAKAEFEFLYDKPYADNKRVRVAGPFTVESLSPHRVLGVDENGELIDPALAGERGEALDGYARRQTFPEMIIENLKAAGVQQARKDDKIVFASLVPWPGEMVHAEGRYLDGGDPHPGPLPRAGEGEGGVHKRAAVFIGPEFGTVTRADLVDAAKEAAEAGFDLLVACAFNYEAHTTEFTRLGALPVLKARMNADLHMAADLKTTDKGNLFVVFGEPDITILTDADDAGRIREGREERIRVRVNGVDVFHPSSGAVVSDGPDGIACWFVDTDYNEESFFVRHAYFLGANDPYKALKTTLKAEIDEDAWATLHSDTSRPFAKPKSGRVAVKVINHLGDEVMKVFKVV